MALLCSDAMTYQPRIYREGLKADGLIQCAVLVKETDLFISASRNASDQAREAVLALRFQLERYITKHPEFLTSLVPLPADEHAPEIVQAMLHASAAAGVGPMAAVAGALAEFTGREILTFCDEVLVENGGDIFLNVNREITIGIYAGSSPLSNCVGIKIDHPHTAQGVCTSSGTVGPSLSFGSADAVTIISASASLADAAATAVGNLVNTAADIQTAIDSGKKISGVTGILIIKDEHMGVWGDINLVTL